MMGQDTLPVLVGVGQAVSHWRAEHGVEAAPSYLSLAEAAARRALAGDTYRALAGQIDTIAMVRTMEDSIPQSGHPFGRAENLPRALAKRIGANPRHAIYAVTGGQSPQSLVNEMAARIHSGQSDIALIAGTEAIGAMKAARRAGLEIDFSDSTHGELDDRGLGASLLSRGEIKHGLVKPAYFYALFENAIAAGKGETRTAHRHAMARLFKGFSEIAAKNPYAQFPKALSIDFLAEPSKENYPFADPFLKWNMAQDAVNQAAAVLIMSEKKADALGVPQTVRIYLHGAGEAADHNISERLRLDGSWAMEVALKRALEQASCAPDVIDFLDLYSCFPCAVFSACAGLGINPDTERRPLTQTGGLPFFGGPGNNYSLHAIASMYDTLKAKPGAKGLVLANGGWMTKEAAGVYSTVRPDTFTPVEPAAMPENFIEPIMGPGEAVLETFTLVHGKQGALQAIAFARTKNGERMITSSAAPETLTVLDAEGPHVGKPLIVEAEGEVNTFRFL